MRKKMLFDLTKIVFDSFAKKYAKGMKTIDFTVDWMDVAVPAIYVVLPKISSLETPTLVFLDLREVININSTRILLLPHLPIFEKDNVVLETKLQHFFKLEVGENESDLIKIEEDISGCKVSLYLESSFDNEVINMTDENNIFLGIYSVDIISMAYSLLLNGSYDWQKEYFKTVDGSIVPLLK